MKNKHLLLALSMLMLVSLMGCAARGAQNGGTLFAPETEDDKVSLSSANTNDTVDAQPNEVFASPVGCSLLPFFFDDETALLDAVCSDEQNDETISSLNEYYRTRSIPDGTSLSQIMVKDFYVALRYDYTDAATEPDDSDPYYLFEWCRTQKEGDTEANVYRTYSPDKIETFQHYYIVNAGTLQNVFWEENGLAFHAVTPASISEDQLAQFCAAEKVMIKPERWVYPEEAYYKNEALGIAIAFPENWVGHLALIEHYDAAPAVTVCCREVAETELERSGEPYYAFIFAVVSADKDDAAALRNLDDPACFTFLGERDGLLY